jgi:hypothetical protein
MAKDRAGSAAEDVFANGEHIDFDGMSGGKSAAENRMTGKRGQRICSKKVKDTSFGANLGKSATNVISRPGKNPRPGPTSEPQSRDR